MGYLQILVAAASMALTYGGVIGTDLLLERMASGGAIEQPAAATPDPGESEER